MHTYMTGRYRDNGNPRVAHTLTQSSLVPWLHVYVAREVESGFRTAQYAVFTDDYGNQVPATQQTVTSLRGSKDVQ